MEAEKCEGLRVESLKSRVWSKKEAWKDLESQECVPRPRRGQGTNLTEGRDVQVVSVEHLCFVHPIVVPSDSVTFLCNGHLTWMDLRRGVPDAFRDSARRSNLVILGPLNQH